MATASGTSPVSWNASRAASLGAPAQRLEALLGRAATHVTVSEGCPLVWHAWPAPSHDAHPLLLLHGGFGSWTHWAANIEALAERFAVWTVDLPGLGASGDLPEPHTVVHIAELLWPAWQHLVGAARPFDVAGFSFGAMVAGQLASLAGHRCRRCLLIGAVGFGPLQHRVELLRPPAGNVAPVRAMAIHRENLARLMFHDQDRIDALAVHIHSDNLARSRFNSRGLAATSALADTLPGISARLVGIWGEWDATAGGATNIAARRALFLEAQPGAAFHVLPNVGHWAMYEAPRAVNALLLQA